MMFPDVPHKNPGSFSPTPTRRAQRRCPNGRCRRLPLAPQQILPATLEISEENRGFHGMMMISMVGMMMIWWE